MVVDFNNTYNSLKIGGIDGRMFAPLVLDELKRRIAEGTTAGIEELGQVLLEIIRDIKRSAGKN
jgi:hypothetical protein